MHSINNTIIGYFQIASLSRRVFVRNYLYKNVFMQIKSIFISKVLHTGRLVLKLSKRELVKGLLKLSVLSFINKCSPLMTVRPGTPEGDLSRYGGNGMSR